MSLLQLIRRAEDALLGLLMFGLVSVSCVQILRRAVWQDGWIHSDTVARTLVLWIALLGALAAVRTGQHVAIDVFGAMLPERVRGMANRLAVVAAACFCGWMSWLAYGLLKLDVEAGMEWLPGVSVLIPFALIPFGFALMAVRFAGQAVTGKPESPRSLTDDVQKAAG